MKLIYSISIIILTLSFAKQHVLNTGIVYDVSQMVKDFPLAGSEDNADFKSVFTSSSLSNSSTVYLYYETDFYSDLMTEVRAFITFLRNMESRNFKPKVIFSIRDVDGQQRKPIIPGNLVDVIDLCLDNIYLVLGLCYNAVWLQNNCHVNGKSFVSEHTTSSIITQIQNYASQPNHSQTGQSKLAVGYQLHINYLDCEDHQSNKKNADLLVIEVPFSRNTGFVESYGLFKDMLDNEIMPSIKNESENKITFLKIIWEANKEREPLKAFFDYPNFYKTYYSQQDNWFNMSSKSLKSVDDLVSHRYKSLISEYMRQWKEDNENISIILSHLHAGINLNYDISKFKERVPVIPYVKNIIESQSNKPPLFAEQLGVTNKILIESLLRIIVTEDFNTLMISGKTWNRMKGSKTDYSNFRISNISNLFYYIEDDEHFEQIRKTPSVLLDFANINSVTMVISSGISDLNNKYWDDILTFPNPKNVSFNIACQIETDIFKTFNFEQKCSNAIACHAVHIRQDFGKKCKLLNNSSTTVIWKQDFSFGKPEKRKYRPEHFLNDVMKKLDTFVVAREIIRIDYPDETVILQLKAVYDTSEAYKGQTPCLYCDVFAERIEHFYEGILTWAQIHDFPVILEALSVKTNFANPLVWNQLRVSTTHQLHNLMESRPIFIRRKYSTSKVFGSWDDGMYPCIPKAIVNDKSLKSTSFRNAGVTFKMDLRSTELQSDEVQTMMLLLLEKFSEVEIWITRKSHLLLLQHTVTLPKFIENLKLNNINKGSIYLKVSEEVCTEVDEQMINQITSKLKEANLQITVSTRNYECVRKFESLGVRLGLTVDDCIGEFQNAVNSSLPIRITSWSKVTYLVCSFDTVWAYNRDEKVMQEYLDSHFYLMKMIKSFYPNLERIHFRLQSMQTNTTRTQQNRDLMMYLTDVNNFAKGYGINYFLLRAFATESNSLEESSFWTITHYDNLTDLNVYQDRQAEYLNKPTWIPNIIVLNANSNENSNENNKTSDVTLLAGGIGVSLLVITAAISIFILWRRSKRLSDIEIAQFRYGHQATLKKAVRERQNNQYTSNLFDGLVFQKEFEISKKDACINKKVILAKGKISTLHLATLSNKECGKRVIVKIFNKNGSKKAIMEVMSELKLLSYLGDHTNLVRFIGCYTKEIRKGILWIFTEFCENGSLQTYLRNRKTVDMLELARFSYGIARGMDYVANQKIIHGNLRTQVVYLDGLNSCKISGFGKLSSKIYALKKCMEMNSKNSKKPAHWQWLAYESLKAMEFSTETDVWSFGVTVWEIFSLGKMPHAEISWDQFMNMTETEMILKKPRPASQEIYELMLQCWCVDSKARPNFSKLVEIIASLLGQKNN